MSRDSDLLVDVRDLHVSFRGVPAVRGVSLQVSPGEVVALVGESGSGKSVTARALLGLAGGTVSGTSSGVDVRAARLRVAGVNVLADATRADGTVPDAASAGRRPGSHGNGDLGRSTGPAREREPSRLRRVLHGVTETRGAQLERRLRDLRGNRVGLVAQDPFAGLDPLRPVGREIADALRLHTGLDAGARRQRVVELLTRAGVPEPELRAGQRPGELSGGLRQRVLIAAAIAAEPDLLIADEPTTALDATVQAGILKLLASFADEGRGVLLISHDLAVVAQLANRILVMREGQVVEEGPATRVVSAPGHSYTRMLLDAVPAERPRRAAPEQPAPGVTVPGPDAVAPDSGEPAPGEPPLLRARDIHVSFRLPGGRRLQAVEGVSAELRRGSSLGIVGESGSGKSTFARVLLGLQRPDSGTMELAGEAWVPGPESRRRSRRRRIAAVPQDPFGALDPRWTVGKTLADAAGARSEVPALLRRVRLTEEIAARRPRNLSPGQRQRVAIARALAQRPELLIADEPLSSLDVSIQAQVLDLLDELRAELGLSLILVSHDLGVVRAVTDDVMVMRDGRIVEHGPTEEIFSHPGEPYTKALVAAAPRLRG
ncbi:ATP-binding cassette domain-containing protein [Sediminivirga luteola]|uniref:ABC transporter ATP-binding protein n=1 Tax=Sediminivirga luteola TaxID=1774748 RepID=A0A8J2U075_9MICO|nr:ABC transporter ATP-binding protein [Sediminivirga luteola]GGA23475.1 ABC transporter ATP-binding protein [Sediminivirga luteola]